MAHSPILGIGGLYGKTQRPGCHHVKRPGLAVEICDSKYNRLPLDVPPRYNSRPVPLGAGNQPPPLKGVKGGLPLSGVWGQRHHKKKPGPLIGKSRRLNEIYSSVGRKQTKLGRWVWHAAPWADGFRLRREGGRGVVGAAAAAEPWYPGASAEQKTQIKPLALAGRPGRRRTTKTLSSSGGA